MASYTPVSVSSYNASPPPDDASTGVDNKITWAGIKTKLGDPLKTALDSIDDNVAAAVTTIASNISASEVSLAAVNATYNIIAGTLYAPATTAMLFLQSAAPVGWTKSTSHDNKAIRLVSGTISSGGSTNFTSVLASRTITSSNMPSHSHTWSVTDTIEFNDSTFVNSVSLSSKSHQLSTQVNLVTSIDTTKATISGTASCSGTSSSSGSGTGWNFAVRYVNTIVATKDA